MNYVKDHWHGRHALSRAFGINFLPPFVLLWWLLDPLVARLQDNAPLAYAVTIVYVVIAFGLVFPWQAVGVMRSSERYLLDYGNPVAGRAAQGVVLAAAVGVIIVAVGAVQRIGARQNYLEFSRLYDRETARVYDLTRVPGTKLAHLRGEIQNGTTRALEAWLDENPDIEGIVLDSSGGRVYEARGVARVVTERGLDTYTLTGCYSACTTAFIAGEKRYLAEGARLGFHQYRFESAKNLGYLDPKEEQEKDRSWYRDHAIDERFLARVFDTPGDDMWFPEASLLLEYRVIDAVVAAASLGGG